MNTSSPSASTVALAASPIAICTGCSTRRRWPASTHHAPLGAGRIGHDHAFLDALGRLSVAVTHDRPGAPFHACAAPNPDSRPGRNQELDRTKLPKIGWLGVWLRAK